MSGDAPDRAVLLARLAEYIETLIAIGELARAEVELHRALIEFPDVAFLHARLGAVLLATGRPDAAALEALAALDLDIDEHEAYRVLARVERSRGENCAAETILLDALGRAPGHPMLLAEYADLLRTVEEHSAARRFYESALAAIPAYAGTHAELGRLDAAAGRGKEARARAGTALRLAPADADAHAALGEICLRTGRIRSARRHLREALRLDPSDESAEHLFRLANRLSRPPGLPLYGLFLIATSRAGPYLGLVLLVAIIVGLSGEDSGPGPLTLVSLVALVSVGGLGALAWLWARLLPVR